MRRRNVDMHRTTARVGITAELRREAKHCRRGAIILLEARSDGDAVLPRATHKAELRHQHTRAEVYALRLNTHRQRVTAIVVHVPFYIRHD